MKHLFLKTALLFAVILSFAFTAPTMHVTGVFGVCDNDPSGISLLINEDHTFSYSDHSMKPGIDVVGTWTLKSDETVVLKSDTEVAFHNKWKISNDGMTAKSRHGMSFYTLKRMK